MLPNILTIYTTGDALFLQNVMNAIAMVTGTGSFVTASALGLLFGIILMAFKSLQTGKGFDLASIVICWIAWNFFFGATATVNIHDVITEEDRPVDNVPAGVAIAGWGISNIGYGITEIMEQAFQSPYSESTITGAMAGNGGVFNDTVRTLNTVATIGLNPQILASIDQDNGPKSNFRVSASNFIKDCTLTAFDLGYRSEQNIFNKSLKEGIDFPEANGVYFTRIIDGSGTNGTVSCDTAFDRIDNMMDKALSNSGSYTNTTLTGLLTGHEHKTENSRLMGEGMQKASDLFNSMSAMNADVQEFMKTAIMFDMFSQGELKQARDSRDFATSLMMVQARQQRNMQWSAESNMFQKTMRPIMTFMEGFTYAITPFCGFLLLLGMFGVKLSLKYFMLIAWVQSWLPCLAIANAYLNSALQRAIWGFRGMDTTTYDPNSFMAVKVLADTTQDFLATGGMFIGAIPVVTLFIFSGSVYALNSLAGRMNGQDFINEKVASPDAISPAPLMQAMSQATTQFGVGSATGYDNVLGSITYRAGGQSQISASEDRLVSAGANLVAASQKTYGDNWLKQLGIADNGTFANSFNSSYKSSYQAAVDFGREIGNKLGVNLDDTESFKLGSALNVGINSAKQTGKTVSQAIQNSVESLDNSLFDKIKKVSTNIKDGITRTGSKVASKGLGTTLGVAGQFDTTYVDTIKDAISNSNDKKINSGLSKSVTADLTTAMSTQLNHSENIGKTHGIASSSAGSMTDQLSEVEQASKAYHEAKSASNSFETTKTITVPQFARLFNMNRNDWGRKIHDQSEKMRAIRGDEYEAQLNAIRSQNAKLLEGTDAATSEAAFEMMAMTQMGGQEGVDNQRFIGELVNGTTLNTRDMTVADNTGTKSYEEYKGQTEAKAANVNDQADAYQMLSSDADNASPDAVYKDNHQKVQSDYNANSGEVLEKNKQNDIVYTMEKTNELSSFILNYGGVSSWKSNQGKNSLQGTILDISRHMSDYTEMEQLVGSYSDKDGKAVTTAANTLATRVLGQGTNKSYDRAQFNAAKGLLSAGYEYSYAEKMGDTDLMAKAMARVNNAQTKFESAFKGLNDEEKAATVSGIFKGAKGDSNAVNAATFVQKAIDLNTQREQYNKNHPNTNSSVNSNNNAMGGVNSSTKPVIHSSSQNGSAAIQTSGTTNVNSGPVNTNLNSANSHNNVPVPRTSNQNPKQAQPVVQSSSQNGSTTIQTGGSTDPKENLVGSVLGNQKAANSRTQKLVQPILNNPRK